MKKRCYHGIVKKELTYAFAAVAVFDVGHFFVCCDACKTVPSSVNTFVVSADFLVFSHKTACLATVLCHFLPNNCFRVPLSSINIM